MDYRGDRDSSTFAVVALLFFGLESSSPWQTGSPSRAASFIHTKFLSDQLFIERVPD